MLHRTTELKAVQSLPSLTAELLIHAATPFPFPTNDIPKSANGGLVKGGVSGSELLRRQHEHAPNPAKLLRLPPQKTHFAIVGKYTHFPDILPIMTILRQLLRQNSENVVLFSHRFPQSVVRATSPATTIANPPSR